MIHIYKLYIFYHFLKNCHIFISISSKTKLFFLYNYSKGSCCPKNNESKSKRVSRAESWRYESNIYVNPRNRARMTTHQLPYQIVPQGENPNNHIASHLGRACQVNHVSITQNRHILFSFKENGLISFLKSSQSKDYGIGHNKNFNKLLKSVVNAKKISSNRMYVLNSKTK